ncbi:MAG: DEAD/DEAH box helicase [Candidatus Micrarchaeia archaeon]
MNDIYKTFISRYKTYTDIQKVAIPIVREGSNCIVTAPTGSGKTEAVVLPLLDMIAKSGKKEGITVIYITPLRALNRDMIARLEWLCSEAGVTIGVRHSDTLQKEKAKQSREAPQLLITTPETLQSILPTISFKDHLKNVKAVVVDEVHEIYYSKRGAQLSLGLERLEELAPKFQRIGISATIGDIGQASKFLCGDRPCKIAKAENHKDASIEIRLETNYGKKLEEALSKYGLDKKALSRLNTVIELIKRSKSTLIFANTRQVVEAVGSRLIYVNSIMPFGGIGVHHGSLDREERIKMENSFKEGKIKAIIATSSLELGIDIGNIDLVIQYGSPKQVLRLVQRIGRSGHSREGVSQGAIIPLNEIDMLESVAIKELANLHEYESFPPHMKALDVLANQLCGIALDKGNTNIDEILGIIRRSHLYSSITREELANLLEFMSKQRMIGYDGSIVTSGPRTRMYYYKHLSVIPDSKRFVVKNIIDNHIISSLDERFVISNVDEGTVFITKGLPWKVVSIDEDVISVEPSVDMDAAVPDWTGEDIPVSIKVAKRVFELVGRNNLSMLEELRDQANYFIPNKEDIFIEYTDKASVVYTGLGTQANEALSRLLAYIISSRRGADVITKSSPYIIYIEESVDAVVSALKSVKAANLERMLSSAIEGTELFRYRFITIAKLFGLVEKGTSVTKSTAKRLIRLLNDTPIYKETQRELLKNYFDLESLSEFASQLESGKLKLKVVEKSRLSPFTNMIINSAYYTKELVSPQIPSEAIIKSFSDSILSKSIKLICTYCGFSFQRKLSEINGKEIRCPSCNSSMIAPHSDEWEKVIRKRISGARLSKAEKEELKEILAYADLLSAYGGRAAVALSVYGVGRKTAARVLMMLKREDNAFFMDLLDAQKTFIRTKKYWSV